MPSPLTNWTWEVQDIIIYVYMSIHLEGVTWLQKQKKKQKTITLVGRIEK